jgi:hypothetical protein
MAQPEVLQCPLCHGHAQVSVSELREFANGDWLQQSMQKVLAAHASTPDVVQPLPPAKDEAGYRDFQKEVHSWNPQLAIWRRSPKE